MVLPWCLPFEPSFRSSDSRLWLFAPLNMVSLAPPPPLLQLQHRDRQRPGSHPHHRSLSPPLTPCRAP
eukprot:844985-Lingulodinium_polyedra.AAC.1